MSTCTCDYCSAKQYPHTNLEDFRKAMCLTGNPYSFYQWDSAKLRGLFPKRNCSTVVRQSVSSIGCDGSAVGRLDILNSLLEAENEFSDRIGFDIVPTRHIEKIKNYQWAYPAAGVWGAIASIGKVVTPHPYLMSVGKEICTQIAVVEKGTAGYVLSSVRSGGMFDTFTLTFTDASVAALDKKNIRVYIDESERSENCKDIERWRIPTDCIEIDGQTLTITGGAWLLGKPELLDSYVPLAKPLSDFGDFSLNPENLDCYVDKLSIVSCTIDSCQGSTAQIRKCSCEACSPDASHCEDCENVTFCIDDARAGILTPSYTCEAFCHSRPKSFCVEYLAGNCKQDWSKFISILAVANFCKPICPCATLGCLAQWYEDLAAEEYKGKTSVDLTDNPLGTRRGHVLAYRKIREASQKSISSIMI